MKKHTALTRATLRSDGCAAQFRSRFVFKLISTYRADLQIDWHYNEAHHSKGPMDGIIGTIKNFVFRQVKSGQIIINLAEDFCKAANHFCPSVPTLFQKSYLILSEPSDIEEALIIPGVLRIHKFTRGPPTATGETQINFFFLTNSKEPCCTQKYATKKKKCRQVDHDFNSLAQIAMRLLYGKTHGC